ncbi:hypothetical protein BDW22DRAFT_1361329 [Trametopsis cervina]|nr:hypothetical protein BDW22DRAFT_1361329 [Trametopsis cervina]
MDSKDGGTSSNLAPPVIPKWHPRVDMVKLAKEKGVKHRMNILKSKDLSKLSDGIRKAFDSSKGYDDRVMRCLVLCSYQPLSDQLSRKPDSIKTMACHIVDAIHYLRYDAGILHRDISGNNIMYELRDSKDCFVLIDFDLAVQVDEEGKPLGPTSRHRTGTLPFMALDVIEDMHLSQTMQDHQPIIHCVRHDFESLFWVCLYFGIKTLSPNTPNRKGEEEERRKYLAKWETGDHDDIHSTKFKILTKFDSLDHISLSDYFEHLRPWYGAFLSCFESGYDAVRNYTKSAIRRKSKRSKSRFPFKSIETWFDCVTRENILRSFKDFEDQESESGPESESKSKSKSMSPSPPKSESGFESSLSDVASFASYD